MPAVERERRGHVEILTINRPEARNAINGGGEPGHVGRPRRARGGRRLLGGRPHRQPATRRSRAGMDLKAFAAGEGGDDHGRDRGFGGITQRDFPKPLIAAVNGSALAGGCEIMLSCDLVVAAEHATFGIPEAKRGLIAGAGGLIRLPEAPAPGHRPRAGADR